MGLVTVQLEKVCIGPFFDRSKTLRKRVENGGEAEKAREDAITKVVVSITQTIKARCSKNIRKSGAIHVKKERSEYGALRNAKSENK